MPAPCRCLCSCYRFPPHHRDMPSHFWAFWGPLPQIEGWLPPNNIHHQIHHQRTGFFRLCSQTVPRFDQVSSEDLAAGPPPSEEDPPSVWRAEWAAIGHRPSARRVPPGDLKSAKGRPQFGAVRGFSAENTEGCQVVGWRGSGWRVVSSRQAPETGQDEAVILGKLFRICRKFRSGPGRVYPTERPKRARR
jgi:hypothetical protein